MLLQDWQVEDILQVSQKLSNNKIFRLQVIFSQFGFCYSMAGVAWLKGGIHVSVRSSPGLALVTMSVH